MTDANRVIPNRAGVQVVVIVSVPLPGGTIEELPLLCRSEGGTTEGQVTWRVLDVGGAGEIDWLVGEVKLAREAISLTVPVAQCDAREHIERAITTWMHEDLSIQSFHWTTPQVGHQA